MKNQDKKRKIIRTLLMIGCFALVVGLFAYAIPNISADVGNNNRYESSSSSSSSSDDSGLLWIIWMLFDVFGPIPALIILVIIGIVVYKMKKNGKLKQIVEDVQNATQQTQNAFTNLGTVDNTNQVAEQIRVIDPSFSQDAFIGWVREVFVKIQQAWSQRDWKVIRPFESNELFSQHSAQLEEYIRNNKINMIEKINVNYCALREFRQDGDKEVMVVELHAIMRDYVIDATTRQVLESDPNKDWNMKYLMTFNRKAGVKTKPGSSNKSTTNCPNCGAPTRITSSGQCDYCDSVITTGDHDWVLSDITSIK